MSVLITCVCGKEFAASEEYARTQCPDCGRDLLLPLPGPYPHALPKSSLSGDNPETGTYWKGAQPQVSGRAIAACALGAIGMVLAVSVLLGPVLGIPAIVLGRRALREIRSSWGDLTGKGLAWAGIIMGCLATAIVPAAVMYCGLESREAARRSQCVNNLKQIGLAMHNFHDHEGHFPGPAITDANGKPLLSWRVAILPYIEQESLYRKFRLDEPWDSPHNKALLHEIPGTYVCPSDPKSDIRATTTRYQAIVGPGAAFEHGRTLGVVDFPDGLSQTLMVAEARDPVPWTKPVDLKFDLTGPLPALGSEHPDGENALLCDGSVRFLHQSVSQPTLRAIIFRDNTSRIGLEDRDVRIWVENRP